MQMYYRLRVQRTTIREARQRENVLKILQKFVDTVVVYVAVIGGDGWMNCGKGYLSIQVSKPKAQLEGKHPRQCNRHVDKFAAPLVGRGLKHRHEHKRFPWKRAKGHVRGKGNPHS